MKRLKVGLKYCGHCNPVVDGPSIVNAAEKVDLQIDFVSWAQKDKDALLIVHGCPKACASRPSFSGPTIEVAGTVLNGKALSAEELPGEIVKSIRGISN